MKTHVVDPVFFRLNTLMTLGVSELHELARKAAGRLTGYRLILGRCLLAMRESKGYKRFGCSSEIHYAACRLGISDGTARDCRKVARLLIGLPELTLAAEFGTIDWSKLREIVAKATPETESFWLKLAKELTYKQIERLVSKTPKGEFPGDVFEEPQRATSELRCQMSEQMLAMLDRARRLYSLERDEAVTTAQVLEWALAAYIAQQPLDSDTLAQVQQEMDRDVSAQKAREIPLVAMARGVAVEMGLIDDQRNVDNSKEETIDKDDQANLDPLTEALGGEVNPEFVGALPETVFQSEPVFGRPEPDSNKVARTGQTDQWQVLSQTASSCHCPPIQNKRLAFNPGNRHTTKAQKREILRREGWCCSTPGCPHRIWFHIHHLIPHSQGGPTLPQNTVGLCAGCHANVHQGTLCIHQQTNGILVFTDAVGHPLARQADLELGSWLDYYIGWEDSEDNSFQHRAFSGAWSVFGPLKTGPPTKSLERV